MENWWRDMGTWLAPFVAGAWAQDAGAGASSLYCRAHWPK